MKTFIGGCFLFLIVVKGLVHAAMTETQLKNAATLIRNVCQPKVNIPDKLIAKMHKGDFVEDERVMCYAECVLRMGRLTKNGKFDLDLALQQVPTLPVERQEALTTTLKNCKDKGQENDKCLAAFETMKCIYFDNPENFVFP